MKLKELCAWVLPGKTLRPYCNEVFTTEEDAHEFLMQTKNYVDSIKNIAVRKHIKKEILAKLELKKLGDIYDIS